MVLMQVALPFSSTVHLKLHPLFQLNGFYVCCFLKFFWHFFTELFVQYHLDSNLIVLQVVLEYYLTDPLPFSFRLGTFSLNDPLIYTPVTLFPFWVLISFRQILILFILSAEQLIFIFSMVFSSMLQQLPFTYGVSISQIQMLLFARTTLPNLFWVIFFHDCDDYYDSFICSFSSREPWKTVQFSHYPTQLLSSPLQSIIFQTIIKYNIKQEFEKYKFKQNFPENFRITHGNLHRQFQSIEGRNRYNSIQSVCLRIPLPFHYLPPTPHLSKQIIVNYLHVFSPKHKNHLNHRVRIHLIHAHNQDKQITSMYFLAAIHLSHSTFSNLLALLFLLH